MKNIKNIEISLSGLSALILAFAPILDPYVLVEISGQDFRLMYLISFLFVLNVLFKKSKLLLNRELIYFILFITLLSVFSFTIGVYGRMLFMSFKNILIWFILSIFLGILWGDFNHDCFKKFAYYIAIVSSLILLIQFILLNMGFSNVFNGKISFLNLSKYDDWSPFYNASGAIRVHSIFQESSYFCIFVLPVFANCLKESKYKISIFFIISILISTSSVGLIGILLILINQSIANKTLTRKIRIKLCVTFLVFSLLIIILYKFNDNIKNIIEFSLFKIFKIKDDLKNERMGSTRLRLLGHIFLFKDLPLFFKLVGLGASQYVNFFDLNISYSSTVVTILLNYGILGLLVFFVWVFTILKKYSLEKIYLIIFVMICFTDQFWFNWYFFYMLTWIFMQKSNNRGDFFLCR